MDSLDDMNTPSKGQLQSSALSIGPLLIHAGKLTREDAEKISLLQVSEGLRFGEAAVKLGLLKESDILYALSQQFSHPYLMGGAGPESLSSELVTAFDPFGPEGEKIRVLRSQLQMRWLTGENQQAALSVISPNRGDGRSRLAANLAIAFAQAGDRTLLIDGDMRNPIQHELFGLPNQYGLSRLLAGRMDERVVSFVAGLPGLGVLTAGPTPPNPMELLGRPAFNTILTKGMASFNVVIVDTPACDQGVDAVLISRHTQTALAVARAHQTRTNAFNQMIENIQQGGSKVVGSVLIDPKKSVMNTGKR
jgi:protein-tyrosine kinase